MALARLRFLLAFVLALGVSTTATSASAFSTRIHIMIANRVHDALEASGDGTIGLLPNGYRVTLPEDDVRAILEHPKAFRAGAIGPDNTVFPAQTDATHGLHASPFEQCELLYQAAVTREERAYALGCFLHGSSDVVAHHYVNFLTGETFTLNPVSEGRASSFSNVVRHILAEDMIQAAAVAADPTAFTLQRLDHEIPRSFVLRTYFDRKSPVYATMAEHSLATYEAHLAAHPDENLVERLATLNVAPYEYLVLAPVFVDEIQEARVALRKVVEDDIAWFQDPTTPEGAELGVTAGLDGQLGTSDDETACAASCPVLYAQYFVQVGLLAPRFDGNGQPLPSAFDKISDELGEDVGLFLPSLLQTIQNLSTTLNAPPGGQTEGLGDLDQATILAHFAPMTGWAQDVANIDYETLIHSILPDWILTLQSTLNAIGVNIQVADLVAALFEPVVAPIRDGIQDFVITTAADYLESFAAEYKASFQVVQAEYEARLAAAAPQDVEGISYDYFYDSGLFVHTFNLSTAALANHEVVLPHGEGAARFGARTFDASHTHEWIQAGVCDHLRAAVFPYGADVQGALSVSVDGVLHPATTDDDSPIECHDGSLFEFASTPGPEACAVTDLETLVADAAHRGSLSRAYPPSYLGLTPTCADVEVPGIPIPGSGGAGGAGGEDAVGGGGSEPTAVDGDDEGCGCRLAGGRDSHAPFWLMGLFGVAFFRRRRGSRRRLLAGSVMAFAMAACGGADDDPAGTGGAGSGASSTGGTNGMGGATSTGGGDVGGTGGGGGAIADPSALLAALDGSTWHGLEVRDGVERAYQLQFDGDAGLWAEIQNPFGPARRRRMRAFKVEDDARTVTTVITSPSDWPFDPQNGLGETWTFEVVESGAGRVLRITGEGGLEELEEGPWPAPTSGLSAMVHVFPSGGLVDEAFCSSGSSGFDYGTFLDFARGLGSEIPLGVDFVAGVDPGPWHDASNNNQFSVRNVPGFDRLGGTELSDSFNFFVVYFGDLQHPGGEIGLRELDDSVEDGVWAFLGDAVGSTAPADIFFEVHGFLFNDDEEVYDQRPAGMIPFELVMARCGAAIQDVDVEVTLASGPWKPIAQAPFTPVVDPTLFPPVW